ncbi:MAG: renalase [Acidimicrobiaceae bacterium]|nr:renalase [Acidimicrobiaceae bacterium]
MRIIVIGAGVAGLTAAAGLVTSGHDVTVLDKGAVPGGRLATGEVAGAVCDEGAQFFTARTEAFTAAVDAWRAEGLVYEWCRGFSAVDGFPRYAASRGMARLAARFAVGLDVRLDTMAFAVRPGSAGAGWSVTLADGAVVVADALVLTCPTPQSASLLISAEVTVPDVLRALEYDRTIAVTLALDGRPAVPSPGGLPQPDDTFSFIADNQAKGISAVPALTLHANADWSLAHWDDDRSLLADQLIAAAGRFVDGRAVVARRVRRWRFATPQAPWPEPCLVVSERPPVVLAGDAFAGPRVEGAFTSGRAAAAALVEVYGRS